MTVAPSPRRARKARGGGRQLAAEAVGRGRRSRSSAGFGPGAGRSRWSFGRSGSSGSAQAVSGDRAPAGSGQLEPARAPGVALAGHAAGGLHRVREATLHSGCACQAPASAQASRRRSRRAGSGSRAGRPGPRCARGNGGRRRRWPGSRCGSCGPPGPGAR